VARGVVAEVVPIAPRQILQTANMRGITEQFALPRARWTFDTDGRRMEPRQNEPMTKMVRRLIDVVSRLA
jgi:hypothetical protein